MKKLIVIADWAGDPLAQQEIRSTVEGYLQHQNGSNVSFVPSTPSTVHTGYLVGQIAEIEERYGKPLETVIYAHTDTRLNAATSREDTKGADFFVVRLGTGLYLCGPNAQHTYSFIRSQIQKVYRYNDIDLHTQYRARDAYARTVAHLMEAMEDELDLEEIHPNLIPPLQGHHVGHVDSHGTIKTTISKEELKGTYEYEQHVTVKINGIEKKLRYIPHLFASFQGELVIYPGSSGHLDEPYLDIGLWQSESDQQHKTAAEHFHSPKPGVEVHIKA
jgi:hypothetical protein